MSGKKINDSPPLVNYEHLRLIIYCFPIPFSCHTSFFCQSPAQAQFFGSVFITLPASIYFIAFDSGVGKQTCMICVCKNVCSQYNGFETMMSVLFN